MGLIFLFTQFGKKYQSLKSEFGLKFHVTGVCKVRKSIYLKILKIERSRIAVEMRKHISRHFASWPGPKDAP